MKIYTGKTDLYLEDTNIENLFINEYMIPANGDYIKVYLFAKMYADKDIIVCNETLSKYLNLPVQKIIDAWIYWESKKVIKRHIHGSNPSDFDIEFICLKQLMYKGEPSPEPLDKDEITDKLNCVLFSENLVSLFSKIEKMAGRPLSPKELNDIKIWSEDWYLEDKVILTAYETGIKGPKKTSDPPYIASIIKKWYEKGLFNQEKLEDYLADNDKRRSIYKRIFKALGFIGRHPSEEEKRIMNIWLDEYMLDISTILEACKKTSGISSPSINYINTILTDWKDSKQVTASGKKALNSGQISKIYEDIRKQNSEVSMNRRKEVYSFSSRVKQIDEELRVLNPKRLKLFLSGQNKTSDYMAMEREIKDLRNERNGILEKGGFPADYLAPIYSCPICKDTGYLDNGEKCVCLTKRLRDM